MYRLRKKRPPFGTEDSPLLEHGYSEEVKVVNGLCTVEHDTTRDYLLKNGYEEIKVEEADIAPSENGSKESEQIAPVKSEPKKKPKKKSRR